MATALFPFDFMLPFAIRLLPFDFPIRLRAVAVAPQESQEVEWELLLWFPFDFTPPPCVEPTPDDAYVSVSVYAA